MGNKMYELGSFIAIAVVIVAAIVGLISKKYLGNDNPIEEAAEAVIKEEIGLDVDLSPEDKKQEQTIPPVLPSKPSSGDSPYFKPGTTPCNSCVVECPFYF